MIPTIDVATRRCAQSLVVSSRETAGILAESASVEWFLLVVQRGSSHQHTNDVLRLRGEPRRSEGVVKIAVATIEMECCEWPFRRNRTERTQRSSRHVISQDFRSTALREWRLLKERWGNSYCAGLLGVVVFSVRSSTRVCL